MTENATATTTFKPATARQRQLLADLSVELGRDIKAPASAKPPVLRVRSGRVARLLASSELPQPETDIRRVRRSPASSSISKDGSRDDAGNASDVC